MQTHIFQTCTSGLVFFIKSRIGDKMRQVSPEMIKNDIKEQNIQFLRLMFTDILGTIKNVEVPVSQIDKVLDGQMMFDGCSIEGFVRISESDMYLKPDLNTWLIFPWETETSTPAKVARLICDVYHANGNVFKGDPRGNLKRVLKEAEELGFTEFNLGPEPEFFLLKFDEDGKVTDTLNDNGGYFDLAPNDLAENCRRDIVLELQALGFEIEASHHEAAPGQHEIDWQYAGAIEACDNIQTFKLIVKTVARKHNLHATFMPKPIEGINGSGMHMNVSLFKGEENAFVDEDGETLSIDAGHFIAGLIDHAMGLTAITNPIVNSYKRLIPGFEAPTSIAWSGQNRTPMIRIPSSRGKSTRIEVRSVDPSANPYLAMACILKAGLQGIKDKMEAPQPKNQNMYDLNEKELEEEGIKQLPSTLKEAINELKASPLMQDALGDHIYTHFVKMKELEWKEYSASVSEWEKDRYLELY